MYEEALRSWQTKKLEIHRFFKRKFPKKGELWIINLGINIGSEQNERRPCLVTQEPNHNEDRTCIIVPASRTIRKTSFEIEGYYFLLHQIRTIDTKRLGRKINRLPEKKVLNLIKKLTTSLK